MTPQLAPSPGRILLIEDSSGDIYLLRHALEDNGVKCEMDVVDDGEKALEAIEQISREGGPAPNVIVLDLNLPKVSGLEILEKIKGSAVLARVPIVILTSSLSDKEKRRAEGFGIDLYMTKPMEINEFMAIGATLQRFCERTALASAQGQ